MLTWQRCWVAVALLGHNPAVSPSLAFLRFHFGCPVPKMAEEHYEVFNQALSGSLPLDSTAALVVAHPSGACDAPARGSASWALLALLQRQSAAAAAASEGGPRVQLAEPLRLLLCSSAQLYQGAPSLAEVEQAGKALQQQLAGLQVEILPSVGPGGHGAS